MEVNELEERDGPTGFDARAAWVLSDVAQLSTLRGSLHDALVGPSRTDAVPLHGVAEQVVLVSSELATNALRHGHPPTVVTLSERQDARLLDVVDHAPDEVPAPAAPRRPGDGGFGLHLAARLADDMGWYRTDGVKHVWATFTLEPRPTAAVPAV